MKVPNKKIITRYAFYAHMDASFYVHMYAELCCYPLSFLTESLKIVSSRRDRYLVCHHLLR